LFMKKILLLLLLVSCSPSWHVNKALKKQPDIFAHESDTIRLRVTNYDTIRLPVGYEVIKREYDTIIVTNTKIVQAKSKYDYRVERDSLRYDLRKAKVRYDFVQDSLKNALKLAKENTKVVTVTEKSKNKGWAKWIFLSVLLIVLAYFGEIIVGAFKNMPVNQR
jgi:predicted choloylglycine hydrolase